MSSFPAILDAEHTHCDYSWPCLDDWCSNLLNERLYQEEFSCSYKCRAPPGGGGGGGGGGAHALDRSWSDPNGNAFRWHIAMHEWVRGGERPPAMEVSRPVFSVSKRLARSCALGIEPSSAGFWPADEPPPAAAFLGGPLGCSADLIFLAAAANLLSCTAICSSATITHQAEHWGGPSGATLSLKEVMPNRCRSSLTNLQFIIDTCA